ncbi:MAG: hypothetical protein GWN62_12435, partial [Aliifodinibius sp.]|nr:hypothetical protein [Nitrosopumilaceae archaeon]NIV12041.1 hypothetical protein [Fodinibius sp.]NIX62292.1 hypothetical protein [Nitrosopumilaceae archaeon]
PAFAHVNSFGLKNFNPDAEASKLEFSLGAGKTAEKLHIPTNRILGELFDDVPEIRDTYTRLSRTNVIQKGNLDDMVNRNSVENQYEYDLSVINGAIVNRAQQAYLNHRLSYKGKRAPQNNIGFPNTKIALSMLQDAFKKPLQKNTLHGG